MAIIQPLNPCLALESRGVQPCLPSRSHPDLSGHVRWGLSSQERDSYLGVSTTKAAEATRLPQPKQSGLGALIFLPPASLDVL